MYRENVIRMFAGTLVLLGVILGAFVSRWWLLLPAFVGFNLFQSSLTGLCPLEIILEKAGVKTPLDEYKARETSAPEETSGHAAPL